MKREAQRIAIAEACGLKIYQADGTTAPAWCNGSMVHNNGNVYHFTDKKTRRVDSLPSYLTDLNAMHEAEMACNIANLSLLRYHDLLIKTHGTIGALISTAAQRAEAFLRTIGKWEE